MVERDTFFLLPEINSDDLDPDLTEFSRRLELDRLSPSWRSLVKQRDGHWDHLSKEKFVRCTNNGGKSGKRRRIKKG